MTIDTFQTDQ